MCRAVEELCKESREEGRIETAQKMLAAGKLTLEEIAEYAGRPLDEVRRMVGEMPQ